MSSLVIVGMSRSIPWLIQQIGTKFPQIMTTWIVPVKESNHLPNLPPSVIRIQDLNSLELKKSLEKADLCISFLPGHESNRLLELSIRSNTHYIDQASEATGIQNRLRESLHEAQSESLIILPGCQFVSGTVGILSRWLLEEFQSIQEMSIQWGSSVSNLHPIDQFLFLLVNEYEDRFQSFLGRDWVLQNGQIQAVPPLSNPEKTAPYPGDEWEAFHCSNGSGTCPWTLSNQLKRFNVKRAFPKSTLDYLRLFQSLNILSDSENTLARDFVQRARIRLEESPYKTESQTTFLKIRGEQRLGGSVGIDVEWTHSASVFSSIDTLTADMILIAVQAYLENQIERGPLPIEESIDPQWFIRRLSATTRLRLIRDGISYSFESDAWQPAGSLLEQ